LQIVAVDLHVDRGGQAEVEHLAHDVGGLKIYRHIRILALKQRANFVLVVGSRP